MAITFTDLEFSSLVDQFEGRAFSTYEFIEVLKRDHPKAWASFEKEYGSGGKGAGKPYSAYSRISRILDYWSKPARRLVDKLEYKKAPKSANWGSVKIRQWARDKNQIRGPVFPEEVLSTSKLFDEGAVVAIVVNRYERDLAARRACIAHHKAICAACGMDFEKRYGPRGAGFIHVHHKVAVSKRGQRHKVDPVEDLVPVCPNCHAMLHTVDDGLTVEALKKLLR
ncbi:HNH endonuclease [Mesorhizobium sp. L2C085B000]|uniref:HNH endonuclease n=1 Tax=Mesorhizobium sp. L2C085B000 TaxID=1287117 RepID=UPI0003D014A6|nr:HNH endonuclease [Mesorhizobium sp. L2C085B000]ESZ12319.1 HNH endonuclease [Mesorhizobium sp. L2C085B000]